MKRTIFLMGGIVWLLFAFGFGCVMAECLGQNSGNRYWLWFLGPITGFFDSLLGQLILLGGFCGIIGLCVIISAGLFAYGMAPKLEGNHSTDRRAQRSSK